MQSHSIDQRGVLTGLAPPIDSFAEDLIGCGPLRNAVEVPNPPPHTKARFFEPMLCLAVPRLPEGPE